MTDFVTVKVSYTEGEIVCDEPDLQLYLLDGPRSIVWEFVSMPPTAVGAMISWGKESPFRAVGMFNDGKKLVASGLTMKAGAFKYSILFFNDKGVVVGTLDPGIVVDPVMPNWPDWD